MSLPICFVNFTLSVDFVVSQKDLDLPLRPLHVGDDQNFCLVNQVIDSIPRCSIRALVAWSEGQLVTTLCFWLLFDFTNFSYQHMVRCFPTHIRVPGPSALTSAIPAPNFILIHKLQVRVEQNSCVLMTFCGVVIRCTKDVPEAQLMSSLTCKKRHLTIICR